MNRKRSFTWNEEEGKGTAHKKGWTKAVEGGGGFDIWHYFVQLSFKSSYTVIVHGHDTKFVIFVYLGIQVGGGDFLL